MAAYTSCNLHRAIALLLTAKPCFNDDWEFVKDVDSALVFNNNVDWEKISLPHTAQIEPLVIKDRQWMGNCFYRKEFSVDSSFKASILL
jgi:beta-galactosidase